MSNSFHVFSDLASSFRLTRPPAIENYQQIRTSDFSWQDEGAEQPTRLPILWYQEVPKVSPKALRFKILKWLASHEIATDEDIAGIVLCTIAALIQDGRQLQEAVDTLERHISEAKVRHCHVLPTLGGGGWEGALEWGGFKFSRLDSQLAYRCQKADAPSHEATARRLQGTPSFWSPHFRCKILDLAGVFWELQTPTVKSHGPVLLYAYFHRSSVLHASDMWSSLEDAFLLPSALGRPILDLSALRQAPGAETWACYSNLGPGGKHSFVARGIFQGKLRVPRFNEAQEYLKSVAGRYKFDVLCESKLYPLLLGVSRSVIRSNDHLYSSRSDEAFLHLIIAVEQVYSVKRNIQETISGRTALIAHRALGIPFGDAVKTIKRIYDRRSRLVHQGESGVSIDDLVSARTVATETARCLARLCAKEESQDSAFREKWLNKLDFLVAGIKAEKLPQNDALLEVGIQPSAAS